MLVHFATKSYRVEFDSDEKFLEWQAALPAMTRTFEGSWLLGPPAYALLKEYSHPLRKPADGIWRCTMKIEFYIRVSISGGSFYQQYNLHEEIQD